MFLVIDRCCRLPGRIVLYQLSLVLRCSSVSHLDVSCPQVLFSRHVGEVRQGHWFDPVKFNWPSQTLEVKSLLLNGKQTEPDYKKCATELLGNIQCIGKGQSVLATDREQ